MDRKAVAFARSWATRYVRTKHPHGLDVEDVENRILESLYKYSRGKMNGRDSARPSQDGEAFAAPKFFFLRLLCPICGLLRRLEGSHHARLRP